MPFAVAAAGLNVPDGSSRKADHDRFNQVLNESYPTIVAAVAERYDPFMQSVDENGGPPASPTARCPAVACYVAPPGHRARGTRTRGAATPLNATEGPTWCRCLRGVPPSGFEPPLPP